MEKNSTFERIALLIDILAYNSESTQPTLELFGNFLNVHVSRLKFLRINKFLTHQTNIHHQAITLERVAQAILKPARGPE